MLVSHHPMSLATGEEGEVYEEHSFVHNMFNSLNSFAGNLMHEQIR